MNYCIPVFACLICYSSISYANFKDGPITNSSGNTSLNYFLNNYRNLSEEDISVYFNTHCSDILSKYSSFTRNQKDLLNFLFSLTPEIYLAIWESIAENLDPDNSSHMLALNDLFNDPIYGYTRSFFGLNWKQKSIRDICEKLINKLKGNPSWINELNSILQGEAWKDITRNGLNDMSGKFQRPPFPGKATLLNLKLDRR